MTRQNSSPLHTPEELLRGATALLQTPEPHFMRAVILEAVAALEAFVQQTIFGLLRHKLDPLLVTWLLERTKMDFDSRLSVLTPVAIGRPIDKQTQLWDRYRRAKAIRNQVTHSGRKVSLAEAREVLSTVYDWLAYLASTAEVDRALLDFREEVVVGNRSIGDEKSAMRAVAEYFGQTSAAASRPEAGEHAAARLPDAIMNLGTTTFLRFGKQHVVLEVKFVRVRDVQRAVESGIANVREYLPSDSKFRGVLLLFNRALNAGDYAPLSTTDDGSVTVLSIPVRV